MGNTSSVDATSNAVLEDGKVSALVSEAQLDDDQIVKIKRQLVFKKESGEGGGDLQAKAAELVAVTQHEGFKVPKVRFGRTGLMMPIVTCGGMRVQQTWCPDSAGVLATTKMSGIDNRCQANLIAIIRRALALGINHFETARMYGTSELQYADALATMIESGEVKRADLIIQTKIRPYETDEEFMKTFEQSWKHMSRLEYIDLFSFHGVSSDPWYDLIFGAKGGKGTGEGAKGSSSSSSSSSSSGSGEAGEAAIEGGNNKAAEEGGGCGGNMRCALELQAQGRIKHIGVSTHGSAAFVRRLIESNSFDYINLHHHFFGSYHASGTSPVSSLASSCSDGQGNASNVRLAKEKKYDMGVFVISPFDKGGALYKPSTTVAQLCGTKLNPIAFSALWLWKLAGVDYTGVSSGFDAATGVVDATCHTLVVGAARPSDFDEVVAAARLLDQPSMLKEAAQAADRLEERWAEVGYANTKKEGEQQALWWEGVPDFFDPKSGGVAIGHILWLHGLVKAFGMFDFAKTRYASLESTRSSSWKAKELFENNVKKWTFNPGLSFSPGPIGDKELEKALERCPNAASAAAAVRECHGWLCKTSKPPTNAERVERGWTVAYDLVPWASFPGDSATLPTVVLQQISGNRAGAGGGPSAGSKKEATTARRALKISNNESTRS